MSIPILAITITIMHPHSFLLVIITITALLPLSLPPINACMEHTPHTPRQPSIILHHHKAINPSVRPMRLLILSPNRQCHQSYACHRHHSPKKPWPEPLKNSYFKSLRRFVVSVPHLSHI
ncbi:hypothetical protein EX30DRAFT_111445 [Ascodesmis nigricans]|uniref:Uncharacterized protein n=1 Tax=Ascodesmis nigricans TaxID=341454 RepID=A0A4S2MQ95_9PEZI|nr:hypothetical protein EX30DRAFT_111445 [Ascodesmis nigricans]